MKSIITICSLMLAINSYAQQTPISYPTDKRIKMVAFSDNNVVPIKGAFFNSTQIQFSGDEMILNVDGGDTKGWEATYHDNLPNMLFIKPTMPDSDSNMTVVTNKHTYYFSLKSDKSINPSANRTYAIKFVYPEDDRKRLNQKLKLHKREKEAILSHNKNPNRYNWDYSFNGDKTIMPAHIFDDGVFTYLKLRHNQDVPAVFAIDNKKGEEALVNVSRQGDYLIIHRLAPQLTLRAGKNHVASVFNNRGIRQIKRG
ncbi:TPA: P-type conjugative transfer protein VirB9 [Legionella pneumophila]